MADTGSALKDRRFRIPRPRLPGGPSTTSSASEIPRTVATLRNSFVFGAERSRAQERGGGASNAGSPGALLPERLLPAAGDVFSGFRGCRPGTSRRKLRDDGVMEEMRLHLGPENVFRQLHRPLHLPFLIEQLQRRHHVFPFFTACRTKTRLFLAPGTAPPISSSFFSSWTPTTFRLRIVTLSFP